MRVLDDAAYGRTAAGLSKEMVLNKAREKYGIKKPRAARRILVAGSAEFKIGSEISLTLDGDVIVVLSGNKVVNVYDGSAGFSPGLIHDLMSLEAIKELIAVSGGVTGVVVEKSFLVLRKGNKLDTKFAAVIRLK